jgi:phosphohistidine phosphatase
MKTLALVRHAKSSWADPGVADHDRPLNHRGRRDAPAMGRLLRDRGFAPDAILSSTAVRAMATATAIAGELGFDVDEVVPVPSLYASSPTTMLAVVGELGDELSTAMLVAHDPGMSELVQQYAPDIEHMPTCAVAEFTFDVESWLELPGAQPVSVRFDFPRG